MYDLVMQMETSFCICVKKSTFIQVPVSFYSVSLHLGHPSYNFTSSTKRSSNMVQKCKRNCLSNKKSAKNIAIQSCKRQYPTSKTRLYLCLITIAEFLIIWEVSYAYWFVTKPLSQWVGRFDIIASIYWNNGSITQKCVQKYHIPDQCLCSKVALT